MTIMDAKELRIGNWVKHPDYGEWQWEFSRSDYDSYTMDAFSPIPLTEEWLIRGGLHDDVSTQNLIFDYGLCFERVGNELFMSDLLGNYKKIDFVHVWQNTYHALTGQELTFKS